MVSRVTRCLSEDFEAFRIRDLSNEKLLYLELDGTYLRYHQGADSLTVCVWDESSSSYRCRQSRILRELEGVLDRRWWPEE